MKALWIRVEAHKVDSVPIAQLAEFLGIEPVIALGYYTALGGAVAEHTEDGHIANVPNATLEGWARWRGKKGDFARAVREILQDGDGKYDEWNETMGKLVERRERDRKRIADRRKREADVGGQSDDSSRTVRELSADNLTTVRELSDATVRDGTVRTTTTRRAAENRPPARAGDPTFDGVMQLVRERLYVPDGKPPSKWAEGRDGSILKQLARVYSYEDIARAIAGVALVRDEPGRYAERVEWLKPSAKATLRVLYHSKSGVLPMFSIAISAFCKHSDSVIGAAE